MEPAGKLEPQPWMTAAATRAVLAALGAAGAQPRFVGGCVRDAVLGRPVTDVDIATTDPPEQVVALIERAGLKAVPTGLAHGTVTAIARGRPFEVTSLRIDVETYGRHAKVAFTDDWQADAARRDLTINALSCTPDGRIFDYFGGLDDLRSGRVRFVGDPRARIREDYLRLLRFFRFHAHYGRGAPDPDGLAAAGELAPEAANLSGERVRAELLRLLAAPDPVPVLTVMAAHGVLGVFLPDARDPTALAALLAIEPDRAAPDAVLRLAALLPPDPAVGRKVAERLRLSRAEQARLVALLEPSEAVRGGDDKALRAALYRGGAAILADQWRLAWARLGPDERRARREALDAALGVAAGWRPRPFPLKGRDATARGVPAGPRVGQLLAAVEAWWVAEDFAPDRAACLAKLEELARG
ncbi:MAG TPA: CCA tRNA nucleotidyltransferase [Kiloniellales bacterium]